jgi:uncharacterized membrane protein (DUF106 family)
MGLSGPAQLKQKDVRGLSGIKLVTGRGSWCGCSIGAMLHTITDLLKNHQLLFTLVLFVLSALFSIYASEIKQFLHNWPRTKERARKARENDLVERLALLKILHNDSYQLIIYLVNRFTGLIFSWLKAMAVLILIEIVSRTPLNQGLVEGVVIGLVTGECYYVRVVLKELGNYDETVRNFQQRLSDLKLSG